MTFRDRVPAFLGGISQQSSSLRRNNFVDDALNVEFLPSEGCTKRYPTEHIAELLSGGSVDLTGYKIKVLARDDEDYIVAIGDGDIKVWDSSGTEISVVNSADGAPDFSYLTNATYRGLRVQQVADALFVANRDTTVATKSDDSRPTWDERGSGGAEAGVFIKQGNYGVTYAVRIKTENMTQAAQVSYTVPASPGDASGRVESSATGGFGLSFTATAAQAAGTAPFDLEAAPGSTNGPVAGETDTPFAANDLRDLIIQKWSSTFPGFGSQTFLTKTDFEFDPATGQCFYRGGGGLISVGDHIEFNRQDTTLAYFIRSDIIARQLIRRLESRFDGSSAERPQITISGNSWDFDPDNAKNSAFRISFDEAIEEFTVTDSESNNLSSGWIDQVDRIEDLPAIWQHGWTCKVSGVNSDEADDYYVRFVSDKWIRDGENPATDNTVDIFDQGVWRESHIVVDTDNALDETTIPHYLQRVADGGEPTGYKFVWEAREWEQREVGDSESNPPPSFVDSRIFDVFWHQNRLGFLSDTNVIFSESGESTSFWRTTVLSLPDSELIDISLAGLSGDTLYNALPFDRRLLVFSEKGQAVVQSDGLFSPKQVEAPVISSFRCYASVKPVLQGRSAFFAYNTGDYTQLREFVPGVQNVENFSDALVTFAVPKLIPNTCRKIQPSAGDEDLLVLTDETDQLYLYQYLRSGGRLEMAAWGRWKIEGATVVDVDVARDTAYFVVVRGGKTYLETVTLGAGRGDQSEDFVVRLDRRAQVATGTYDISTDETTYTVPYAFDANDPMEVVADTGGTLLFGSQLDVVEIDAAGGTLKVRGDTSAQPVFVGRSYTSSITLSKPLFMEQHEEGMSAASGGNTLVREFTCHLDDTGYLKSTVNFVDSEASEQEFLGDEMDVGRLSSGSVRSGEFTVEIAADVDEFELVLSNDTPLPSTIVSGSWALRYNNKYRSL